MRQRSDRKQCIIGQRRAQSQHIIRIERFERPFCDFDDLVCFHPIHSSTRQEAQKFSVYACYAVNNQRLLTSVATCLCAVKLIP